MMDDVDYVKLYFTICIDVNTSILMFLELNLSESTRNRIKLIHKDLIEESPFRSQRLTNDNLEYIKQFPNLSNMKEGKYIISCAHFLELMSDPRSGIKSLDDNYITIIKYAARNVESHNKVVEYINH